MNNTALGAESIIFISEAHEKFYYEKLKEVRYQDVYHKAPVLAQLEKTYGATDVNMPFEERIMEIADRIAQDYYEELLP